MKADTLINIAQYPINDPASPRYREILDEVHSAMSENGCAVLKHFLTDAGITALVSEAERAAPFAHSSFNRTNPYFTQDDESLFYSGR